MTSEVGTPVLLEIPAFARMTLGYGASLGAGPLDDEIATKTWALWDDDVGVNPCNPSNPRLMVWGC